MLNNHYAPRAGLGAPARVKTGSQAPIKGHGAGDLCQAFRGAILAVLGHAPDVIEPGRLHRFTTNGRRGDSAGWCRLFEDLRGGVFGCHRQGLQQTWHVADQAGMPWLQRADLQRQIKHLAAKRAAQQGQQWAANAARLAAIWAECIPLTPGDPAALYLQRRGLGDVWPVPTVLRLHRAMAYWHGPEKLGTFAAMVAPIVAPDGRTVALHRTYLTGDGRKADVPSPKKLTATAGPLAGACIALHEPAQGCIGIAEGIETALAAWRASSVPTLASYCAGNLAAWQWPPHTRRLVIFADADEPGRAAAQALKARAAAARLRCEVLTPNKPGADWCDVWAERGAARVNGEGAA
ncbi:MAG: toprim domain-containing protein [Burkholderiales bacterium]|nr:toprim domain-containing protein [Burkholderiales bacterium]